MLEFVAEVARGAGLEDYRVLVNVGPGGGQTIFHLIGTFWVEGSAGCRHEEYAVSFIAEIEEQLESAMRDGDAGAATRCA